MLVIYKLFVIGGLNTYLIDDIIPFIKKLWLAFVGQKPVFFAFSKKTNIGNDCH